MNEFIDVPIEIGVPLPTKYNYADLKVCVDAACNTASFLQEHGAQYSKDLTRQEKEKAAEMALEYAENEKAASKKHDSNKLAKQTPQTILYAKSILDEYGHKVAQSAQQIRHLVTTKLIHETENADPKVRLKALELLGKISDVGLFSEKTEVVVTHQTSDELKDKLRKKLEKLINPPKEDPDKTKQLEAIVTNKDPDLDFSSVIEDADYEEVNEGETQ